MEHREQIAAVIIGLAEYYDKTLSQTQIDMYLEDLLDLSPQELLAAVKEYRNDPKNAFFPLPAKLKSTIRPASDPETEAALLAERIAGAIARVGPYQTPRLPEAEMQIIRYAGGWQQLCELVTNDNLATYKAQWRNAMRGILANERRASILELPTPSNHPPLDMTKLFPEWPKEGA